MLASLLLLNAGLAVSMVVWRPSLIEVVMHLSDLLLIGFVIGLIASGVILRRAYRRTTVEHLRRQIRLIAMACFFVAVAWVLLLVLPNFALGKTLIADHWIDLLTGAVPLAYLVGGVAPDLYRIDRILLRLGIHAGTVTLLAGLLAGIATVFALHDISAVLWMAFCFVVLYRPVQQLSFHLLPTHANPAHNTYQALHAAMTRMTSTLDAPTLVDALCGGVRATFGTPALAFYTGDIEGSNELKCIVQERLPQLPKTIAAGALTEQFARLSPVTESRMLHAALTQVSLSAVEEQALRLPGVVLWCPIRHTQGHSWVCYSWACVAISTRTGQRIYGSYSA